MQRAIVFYHCSGDTAMKVMSIFGTRPEMIKLWSTLKLLDQLNFEHIMVHTGQNFTPELKDFFFRDLELRAPDYELGITTKSYGEEVADVIIKSEELFKKIKPDALLILGDTYSGLAIMPATHHGIKTFHMEAGLRAYDKRMPETRNRILIDHMSSILLPFNQYHRENLIRENIHPSKIIVTGNPTYEAMWHFMPKIEASNVLDTLGLEVGNYILATAHRSENVDNDVYRNNIVQALGAIASTYKKKVIFSCHPRTMNKLGNTKMPAGVEIMKPLGFYDFNKLVKHAFCFLSDSGTAPEEAILYGLPCVTLRQTTERPETIEAGGTVVAGMKLENIVAAVETVVAQPRKTRYELERDFSPANIVVNAIRCDITNYF
jgi:UDP-N-acetylglucosamine 2-epimerase (non-hydrolysing)